MSDLIIPTEELNELIVGTDEEGSLSVDASSDPGVTVVKDYELMNNKPQIEGNTLIGNKTFAELGLEELSNTEIQDIINSLT